MHPWRERLGRWFTPIARRSPLPPNAITVASLLLNLIATWLLVAGGRRPAFFLAAIVLVTLAGFGDALDGLVARVQGKETRFGDLLDHFCDRLSDSLLAAGWMFGNGVRESLLVAVTIAVMLDGYLGTQIEATFGSRHYESLGRGEFVLALIVFPIVSFILFSNGWAGLRFGGATVAEWMSILLLLFAVIGIVQRLVLARRMERP
ncbi:MAG TPA: CDP-alcohol phosphatidyltransferase family protein [Thermoanaerobaculia bacterium]|jgi:archaetidylinositol phosphate synthase|nr:CDP-alcohol phosphatidyltransferase family protein [Thermoanaerobaculia bacterium]